MLGLTNTYKNITKVSLLENDVPYALKSDTEAQIKNGVYAVTANGLLIDYTTADNTCVAIAFISDNLRVMIAKNDATDGTNTTFYWGYNLKENDVPNLANCSDSVTAKADYNGKSNTNAIIASYTVLGENMNNRDMCKVLETYNEGGYNDWYIPSYGLLHEFYLNLDVIENALATIGGTSFIDSKAYWSSSELSNDDAWNLSFNSTYIILTTSKSSNNSLHVRFVRDLTYPLKEKVFEIENRLNDSNYILDDIVSDGVYAVSASGQLIDYHIADSSCIAVALISSNQKVMIPKTDATDGTNTTLLWGKNFYNQNVPNLENLADNTAAKADYNGKANTAAIIAGYAALGKDMDSRDMCKVLETYNEAGYTDWYIPACGQLCEIWSNRTAINAALAKIGGTALNESANYWSSSEFSVTDAWYVYFPNGNIFVDYKHFNKLVRFIRDILAKPLKERVSDLEQSIPTKVSQLENDKNYIENGDGYNTGVYIAVQSGKLINPDEYDSTTETAVGVAVIDPKANFIIGLNHTTKIPWGTSAQGFYIDISGLTNYSSAETAATDIDGIANTDVITSIYSGTDCAAGLAKSQTIMYGSDSLTGYLGSAGEWLIVLNNYEAVKSATAIAGGTAFQITSSYYWTSTEHSSSNAWGASSTGVFDYYEKYYSLSNNGVVPFYKIDNETTVLSKINLISTPTGSSTAPIYIDSNGNITSTTYGGGTKVTLNGSEKGGSTASFYAPTSAGTSGYILTSNGSGAPSWLSPGKKIASISGSNVVSLSKTMHTVITDFTSGKLYYVQSTTQLEEYSFEFVCPENFPGITIYPSTSWINIPETFTAGKTYIGSILGNTGIILECETALDYGDSSSVSWSMSASLPVVSGTSVSQTVNILLDTRVMPQTNTTITNCVKIYNSVIGTKYYTPSLNEGFIDKFSTTVTLQRTFSDANVISFLRPDPTKYDILSLAIGSTLVTFLLNTPLSFNKTKSGGGGYTLYIGTLKSSS